jgi:sterol desaturase/sphingolipid hydroxylase (fatty acid hydroxylase superfamily)
MSFMDTLTDWWYSLDPQVAEYLTQVLRTAAWLVILAVVFTPLERLFALHPKKIFRKGTVTDVGYYFLNSLVPGLLLSFPLAGLALFARHALPAGFIGVVVALPLWARLFAGMVAGEVGYYWGHRWSHEIPFLWRFHKVHHSAEELDYLVSTRAHPLDMVFSRLCEFTPMYALGLASPVAFKGNLVPILVTLIGTMWGFFIHANVTWRFGPLEWLVSTPAFHHWHHTNDGPEVINKNYAPMLPWVDWIFGSLYLPKDRQPQRYGIDEKVSPILIGQLVDPLLIWRKSGVPAGQAGQAKDEVAVDVAATGVTDAESVLLTKTDA